MSADDDDAPTGPDSVSKSLHTSHLQIAGAFRLTAIPSSERTMTGLDSMGGMNKK